MNANTRAIRDYVKDNRYSPKLSLNFVPAMGSPSSQTNPMLDSLAITAAIRDAAKLARNR